jgi:20S proteasome alpha/beta subunit
MTIGARCVDGVVIVGDRKITDTMGTLLRYETKLGGIFHNLIFGLYG